MTNCYSSLILPFQKNKGRFVQNIVEICITSSFCIKIDIVNFMLMNMSIPNLNQQYLCSFIINIFKYTSNYTFIKQNQCLSILNLFLFDEDYNQDLFMERYIHGNFIFYGCIFFPNFSFSFNIKVFKQHLYKH